MKKRKGTEKKYQSKMFTSEEQTGSGQLNLLNSIDRESEKKNKV